MKRLLFALALWVLLLSPTPGKGDLVYCGACDTGNEPNNKRCISCKALL